MFGPPVQLFGPGLQMYGACIAGHLLKKVAAKDVSQPSPRADVIRLQK